MRGPTGESGRAPVRPAGGGPALAALLLVLAGSPGCAGWLPAPLAPWWSGAVHGRLAQAPADGERPPRVVYLEPEAGAAPPRGTLPPATVQQRGSDFAPPFLVVAAGQEVRFPGGGEVYHRVFSYSEPNDFDLGPAERGGSRSVALRHPGVVRLYCSLHPWETGLIFVSPTPWFASVDDSGAYEIRGVPPGRYRLVAWSEATAGAAADVTVRRGRSTAVEVPAPASDGAVR